MTASMVMVGGDALGGLSARGSAPLLLVRGSGAVGCFDAPVPLEELEEALAAGPEDARALFCKYHSAPVKGSSCNDYGRAGKEGKTTSNTSS